eukprot:190057-Chlamydomonas_euryale.AAC.7
MQVRAMRLVVMPQVGKGRRAMHFGTSTMHRPSSLEGKARALPYGADHLRIAQRGACFVVAPFMPPDPICF